MVSTWMDFITQTLEKANRPLTNREIWQLGVKYGYSVLLKNKGDVNYPLQSLGTYISKDLKDGDNGKLISIEIDGVTHYGLKSKNYEGNNGLIDKNDVDSTKKRGKNKVEDKKKYNQDERKLHPILTYYLRNSPDFGIYTKTIIHNTDKRTGQVEEGTFWLHPDMVGVYYPYADEDGFDKGVNRKVWQYRANITNEDKITLYSFEIKQKLSKDTYKKHFFQALSNSSWANYGYLVAYNIDDDIKKYLIRLSNKYGIGIIQLNSKLDSFYGDIVNSAKFNEVIDWDMVRDLLQTKDFAQFMKQISMDVESTNSNPETITVNEEGYDKINIDTINSSVQYMKEKFDIDR